MQQETEKTMDSKFTASDAQYLEHAANYHVKLFWSIWKTRSIPEEGWSEALLSGFMQWLASIDSNNRVDITPIGAGEREGRVVCPLVSRMHFNMSHGVGRSGNVADVQPKALGSSMLSAIANQFALQALRIAGVSTCRGALVVPVATGMAIMLCLSSLRKKNPMANHVIWCRIDQKSCFKCILTAGLTPLIVEPIRADDSDALITNVKRIEELLVEYKDKVLCVITTTSCFAPRAPDSILEVSKICAEHKVGHLVNNAYGLQLKGMCEQLDECNKVGRIDAFVQSTDKNFQVPVGGAIIGTFKKSHIEPIAKIYPGRASAAPARDLVLTLLFLGKVGLRKQFEKRVQNYEVLKEKMTKFAESIEERILNVSQNGISLAMTLQTIPRHKQTLFGSVLFNRGITGARAISSTEYETKVDDYHFKNFGAHSSEDHVGYLNVACGVGMTEMEIDELITRLEANYHRFIRKSCRTTESPEEADEKENQENQPQL